MTVARPAGARPVRAQARFVGVGRGRTRLDVTEAGIRRLPPSFGGRRALALVGIGLLAAVALVGVVSPGAGPAAAGATTTQQLGTFDASAGGIDLLDLGAKGLLVLVLLWITLNVLRRVQAGPSPATSRLVVLESRPLAPKASLHLLAVGERRLVVGLTAAGMVALAELDAADVPEPAAAADEGIAPALRSLVPAAVLLPEPLRAALGTLLPLGSRRR